MRYTHLNKAARIMMLDNGITPRKSDYEKISALGVGYDCEAINTWLGTLNDNELETLCAGDEAEWATILHGSPEGTNTLLEEIFSMLGE